MKNILVVDTAAEIGGALTILNSFYQAAVNEKLKNKWFFLVSRPAYEITENVKILRFPWTKKTKLHRLVFDLYVVPKLIKELKIDAVISLQNNAVHTKKPQIVYVHQSIPFSKYRFSFKKNKSLWFIQNILKISICNGIRRAKKVVVQSEWMKQACSSVARADNKKFIVLPPEVDLAGIRPFQARNIAINKFFYPAIAQEYKNHSVILKACKILQNKGIFDYNVEFTFDPEQNDYARALYKLVEKDKLPVTFCGRLDFEGMFERYESSILIFPSFLETVGLPLKESASAGGVILSADCPYAHEALGNYKNVRYFQNDDAAAVSDYMEQCITNGIGYQPCEASQPKQTSWKVVFEEVYKL